MCSKGLYVFCRDLRVADNLSLLHFSRLVDSVVVAFILNPRQIKKTAKNRHYFSTNALQFMCESLLDLHKQCDEKLYLLRGDPGKVLGMLLKADSNICLVGTHDDYSFFAEKRKRDMQAACHAHDVEFQTFANDLTLIPLDRLCKADGSGYKKFHSFYQSVKKEKIKVTPQNQDVVVFAELRGTTKLRKEGLLKNIEYLGTLYEENTLLAQRGGRTRGLEILEMLSKEKSYFKQYPEFHNMLDYSTLNISGYLNFGCLSVRETYIAVKKVLGGKSEILKQLWWRDFFLQALVFLEGGTLYNYMDERYKRIKWKNSRSDWSKIVKAQTGFLIVDAGIRQMQQTGYMHNRARMIVGTFWTKYCLIDTFHPVYGSQVGYSKYLLDAVGCSQNKMNQHWITEFDYPGKKFAPKNNPLAGRPMDVSNDIMIKKFDPECTYIKEWLPELATVDVKDLRHWDKEKCKEYGVHVPPMFPDAKIKYKDWLRACKKAK